MNLEETRKNWHISEKTLISWIDNGFIPDIKMENGRICIEDLKPFALKKGTKITVDSVRKYILRACKKLNYIDYNILHIEREHFVAIMIQLEENEYIRKSFPSAEYFSNRNFILTEKGSKFLKKKLNLENLNFNIEINL